MLLKENALSRKKIVKGKNRYYLFLYKCLGCDTILEIQSSSLKTHSCKCRRCSQLGEPYMYIYNELLNHKKSNCDVKITFDEFLELISKNECHYCGSELIYNKHSKEWGKSNSRAYHLDRKDNNFCYEKNNLVTCCWECNRLKSDRFTYDEFILLSPILKSIMKNRN